MPCDHRKALDLATVKNWDGAHKLVQKHSDKLSCLIHGYLHRVEGDLDNAGYWYGQGGEGLPDNALDDELKRLYRMIE